MATVAADLYVVVAPIAVAFAGFGGLASAVGQRRGGDDSRVDAFRLATMLFSSLSATLLGLLPATLESLLIADRPAVRLSALAAVGAFVVYVPLGIARARRLRDVPGFSKGGTLVNSSCLLTAFVALCYAHSVSGQTSWPDFTCLA